MSIDFFPPRPNARPMIYAYAETNPDLDGLLKVGYTTRSPQERVAAQFPVIKPGKLPYRYEHFGITDEEVTFIEAIVRPMEDAK